MCVSERERLFSLSLPSGSVSPHIAPFISDLFLPVLVTQLLTVFSGESYNKMLGFLSTGEICHSAIGRYEKSTIFFKQMQEIVCHYFYLNRLLLLLIIVNNNNITRTKSF